MDRKSWSLEWQYIVWSDESHFNLYQNDGRQEYGINQKKNMTLIVLHLPISMVEGV